MGAQVSENDDLQGMWAPDVHKIKPSSAVAQLLTAFAGLAIFSAGIYVIQAPPPAVRDSLLVSLARKLTAVFLLICVGCAAATTSLPLQWTCPRAVWI